MPTQLCGVMVLGIMVLTMVAFAVSPRGGEAEEKAKDSPGTTKRWSFEGEKVGSIAKGFTGEVGEWKVATDPTAPSMENVLAQTAKSGGPVFNVTLVKDSAFKDLELTVKLRSVAGETDQGGGLVWRAKDAKNYYIARYNPLEDNYRVYKVVDGKRTQLASADIDKKEGWRTLKVTARGEEIACYLDDKKYLEVKDDTFREAGKIGLWTKADAQTHFDDLMVAEGKKEGEK